MSKKQNPMTKHGNTQELLGAYRLLEDWVSAMADRVRNPIAGIVAALKIIEEQVNPEKRRTSIDKKVIYDVSQRITGRLMELDQYLSELSNFSQPTSLSPEHFDLSTVMKSVCQEFSQRTGYDSPTHLSVECDPFEIYADKQKMAQTLQALILNSIEAIGAKPNPKIHLKAEHSAVNQQTVITIDDNGPGFPMDVHEQLMKPFTSFKETGSGLGLALVKKYIEAHQGTVALNNIQDPQMGARVTITLKNSLTNINGN